MIVNNIKKWFGKISLSHVVLKVFMRTVPRELTFHENWPIIWFCVLVIILSWPLRLKIYNK